MKTIVRIAFVAACLVASAHAFPNAQRDSFEDFDGFSMSNYMNEAITRMRQNFMNYFWNWNIPDFTNMKIPEGANTTSTTKVIDGHVVTINETTYTSKDEDGGTAFRIRIIDVKPANDTLPDDNPESMTVAPEATESRETIEEMNNEIPKNTDVLTA